MTEADSTIPVRFCIPNPYRDPVRRALFAPVAWVLDRLVGLNGIDAIYHGAAAAPPDRSFADRLLDVMDVTYNVSEQDLERIPADGPVVVVANHCFGGVEGIILASLLQSVRPDIRIMANYILGRIPEMRDLFILVDPFAGREAARRNLRPLKEALGWLKEGGMMGCFPSGEVAHYTLPRGTLAEPEWNTTIAKLIRRSDAAVVPVFFEGTNSLLFHVLGLLHPRLRTAMLPRQVVNKRGREVRVHVGSPIPASKLKGMADDREAMGYLRLRTYNLRNRREREKRRLIRLPHPRRRRPAEEPVVAPLPPDRLVAELAALPDAQRLVENGDLEVWFARALQVPAILREIGRLREVTFRAVGEGTGRAIDLDRYDAFYIHLFLWNRKDREIAAAYRLGPTDEILPRWGKRGLYTTSLFRYGRRLLDHIDPGLEMGRSFVRESYQRNYSSLYMLWKGIGHFVVQHPQYRILFGPVSISDNYRTSSRNLLVSFLKMNNFRPDLAKLVHARTPLRTSFLRKLKANKLRTAVETMEEVDALIADVESELSGAPILLKQYLKLGGKLLGFNLDPKFGNVLDGLILVDLASTDERILKRYMGAEGIRLLSARWKGERREE